MSEGQPKKSAKDYFKGNKIGFAVVGATVLVVGGLTLLSYSKRTATPPSSVAAPPPVNSVAGGQATPQYNNEVAQANVQNGRIAQSNGQSFVPVPTGAASDAYSGAPIQPTLGMTGHAATVPAPAGAQLAQPIAQAAPPAQLTMANPPQAYLDEVKSVLGAISPAVPQMVPVSNTVEAAATAAAATASTSPAAATAQAASFPAGIDPVQYAVAELAANSDVPGPVLLKIPEGPLKGATLIGAFQRESGYLSIRLTSMQWKGISWTTNAVAVDPNTSLPAVRSAVDNHTISRYASLLGGAFLGALQGYGQAIAQSGQTTVQTVGNAATVTTNPTMTPHQALIIAGATAAGTAAQTVGQSVSAGWNQVPTVTLAAGSGVGVLFIEPPKPSSASQAASPAAATTHQASTVSSQPEMPAKTISSTPLIRVGSPIGIVSPQSATTQP